MKNNKLLAENYLFEAASRYFEEDSINEKTVLATLPDGRKVAVDDEDYESLADVTADEYLGDIDPEERPGSFRTAGYTGTATRLANRAAFKAADAERYNANLEAGSETFKSLIPSINSMIQAAAKAALDQQALVKQSDGSWYISQDSANQIQDAIWRKIIAPAIKTSGEKMNNSPIRAAWENYIGWRGGKGAKLAALKNSVYASATAAEEEKAAAEAAAAEAAQKATTKSGRKKKNESSEFAKTLNKYVNEALAYAYSDRYGVTLTEANKMFVVNDMID